MFWMYSVTVPLYKNVEHQQNACSVVHTEKFLSVLFFLHNSRSVATKAAQLIKFVFVLFKGLLHFKPIIPIVLNPALLLLLLT